MPDRPRFGWRVLLASTLLAAIAAAATLVLLSDGGDDDPSPREPVGTIALEPEGDADGGDTGEPDAGDDDQGADEPEGVTFTEFDGAEVELASLRGQPVLVNFFASTCVPCVTEMPAFEEVHQQVGERVVFLGLAVSDRSEDALELVDRTGVTYLTAQDRDGAVIEALGGTLLPTTVLLGADGQILVRHAGALDADGLRALLADELGITAS